MSKLTLFILFLVYEKAYNGANQSKLWDILTWYDLSTNLVNAVKSFHVTFSIAFNKENKDII
jgi:hypothetical protein